VTIPISLLNYDMDFVAVGRM